VLDHGSVVAALARLQQPPADKALVLSILFIRPGKPLAKLSIFAGLNRREVDNIDEHADDLLRISLSCADS
jgi:hypothetical protein